MFSFGDLHFKSQSAEIFFKSKKKQNTSFASRCSLSKCNYLISHNEHNPKMTLALRKEITQTTME